MAERPPIWPVFVAYIGAFAIIVALYRARQTTHVEDINSLKF